MEHDGLTQQPELHKLESDAELYDLAALQADTLLKIPLECQSPPFVAGQIVTLTIGSATDGILAADALVDALEDGRVVLRLHSPISRQQRRTDVRLPLDVPARRTLRLVPGAEAEPVRTRVLDISAGGLLVGTDHALRAGERLVVAFTLPGDGQELRASLVVRHSRNAEGSLFLWESGCQFQVVRPADRERIARYIFAQQREAVRRRRALAA